VATNGSGQTVATWLEVDAQETSAFPRDLLGVYASLYDDVSGWSTPVKLDDGTQQYYAPGTVYDHTPQPVVTASGNMVVVWHYYTNGFGLWSAEYSTGTWNPAHRIDDGTTSSNREINLSLDALDKVHVVWVARDASGNDRVLYSRLDDGSSIWLTPASLEAIEGGVNAPKVAANINGRVVVSWLNDNTSLDLYATQFDADQQLWSTPENVAAGVSSSKQPTVSLDNDDNVLILWQYTNLWYVRYTPTDGWAAKASVPAGRHGMHFSLAPQGTASLHAIWAYVESGVAPKLYVSNYE
jgi:hypothetical protein